MSFFYESLFCRFISLFYAWRVFCACISLFNAFFIGLIFRFILLVFVTGWRRPIGCLISCITFRKLAANYRALLRKMTYKDKASYESSPPCTGLVYRSFSFVSFIYLLNASVVLVYAFYTCLSHITFVSLFYACAPIYL